MQFTIVLAAVAAAVVGVEASYAPFYFANPSSGPQCLLRGSYNRRSDSYSCKIGSCNSPVQLYHQGNGKYLQSSNGYCLTAVNSKPGCKVVLAPCQVTPGSCWTKVGQQYKNKHGYCLHGSNGQLYQKPCGRPAYAPQAWQCGKPAPVTTTTVVYTPTYTPTYTPPAPTGCTCAQWDGSCESYGYGKYELVSRPWSVKCASGKYSDDCFNVCCIKKPVYTTTTYKPTYTPPAASTCGDYFANSYRTCGYGKVQADDSTPCGNHYDGSCSEVCCVRSYTKTTSDYTTKTTSHYTTSTYTPDYTTSTYTPDYTSKVPEVPDYTENATCQDWFNAYNACASADDVQNVDAECPGDVGTCSATLCCSSYQKY